MENFEEFKKIQSSFRFIFQALLCTISLGLGFRVLGSGLGFLFVFQALRCTISQAGSTRISGAEALFRARSCGRLTFMCPRTAMYVSLYCYICVLILLWMCPHSRLVDKDFSGVISREELRALIENALYIVTSDAAFDIIFNTIDTDDSGFSLSLSHSLSLALALSFSGVRSGYFQPERPTN